MGKPFFAFGTEPPACQLQCWSLEPYLKQWLLQEQSTRNMPSKEASGSFLGSLVRIRIPPALHRVRPSRRIDLREGVISLVSCCSLAVCMPAEAM